MIRGWDLILPVSGATSTLARGATQLSPRAGSTSLSQQPTRPWGWDFHTMRGGIDPGNHRFRSRVVGDVEVWKDF